ncbi:26317_t:CDS:2, partial [Gigaspora rosea]
GQQSRDHFDIKLWHYDWIVKALETKEGVEELAAYKFATQSLLCTYTPAVKQKFIHRETTFFLTFTRANKYKLCAPIGVRIGIQDMHVTSKLEFDEMRRAISDAFTDTLADLPASLDRIPNEIREELPFELPIHDRANTRPLVLALRRLYKFDKLPDNYFKRRYALPQDPKT